MSGDGAGRFTAEEARAIAGISAGFQTIYPKIFHATAKQMMYELSLVMLEGAVLDSNGARHGLHLRLSAAQREEARECFCALWSILKAAKLERSPFGASQADERFQGFLRGLSVARRRKRSKRLDRGK